jgi:SEL1 protein
MYHGIATEKNYKLAMKYFQLASQSGHILALYNLAYMHASGIGVTRSCSLATEMLKNVAERGRWAERFMDAFTKYQAGGMEEAAIRYLFLAELGYEVAQTNFAFIMDQSEGAQLLFSSDQTYRRALIYWQRAANQEYPLARIKLGDYSYYGLGTPIDFVASANHYKVRKHY